MTGWNYKFNGDTSVKDKGMRKCMSISLSDKISRSLMCWWLFIFLLVDWFLWIKSNNEWQYLPYMSAGLINSH